MESKKAFENRLLIEGLVEMSRAKPFTLHQKKEYVMAEKVEHISRGLKSLFLIHGIFSLIVAVVLLFAPFTWAELTKYGSIDPNPMRLLGAFTLALVVKDWFGFIAEDWSEVRIIVALEVMYTLFGGLISLYVLMFVAASNAVLFNAIVFAAFFCAWTWLYMKHR